MADPRAPSCPGMAHSPLHSCCCPPRGWLLKGLSSGLCCCSEPPGPCQIGVVGWGGAAPAAFHTVADPLNSLPYSHRPPSSFSAEGALWLQGWPLAPCQVPCLLSCLGMLLSSTTLPP